MSLTGSLEDLPLLDIIQIVSFSKKTGYLAIRVDGQDAAIVFHAGLVLCSYTWDSLPVDARAQALSAAAREGMIRKRIEIALEQLIRLREGEFNFSLTEDMPTHVGTRDIRPETMAEGINPQELLLDLARGMDEDRRDSSAVLEASFASPDDVLDDDLSSVSAFVRDAPGMETADEDDFGSYTMPVPVIEPHGTPVSSSDPSAMRDLLDLPVPVPIPEAPTAAPAPREVARRIMLVDDEDDVRGTIARHLIAGGYEVHEAGSPDEAVRLAGRLVKAGIGEFLLVTDLGMPASGGASFQGGFEVVKRLWKMNLKPPVLMMTESLGTTLRARAKQMGVTHFVFKPGLSKLDPEQFEADLEAFAARLVNDLLPVMQQPRASQALSAPQPSRATAEAPVPVPDEASRQMRALRQHLDDLRQRGDAAQISLLIMKVAREFFERSVLFLVKNDELRGLGGFGPAPREENLNLLARDVVIPLSEPTVFQRVVNGCKPWAGELPDGKGGGQLMVKIGRFKSTQVALLPLLTHRQTTALLFGDNPETGRELERLDALEVFLDQAGVALENVFLQRKLQSLEA